MHRKIRKILFLIFVGIFFTGAPLIVLYTAGYRVNQTTWRVQRTGVIAITTFPKNATVAVNNIVISTKTPFINQRLMPGNYHVLLAKNGYKPWEQNVTVDSGQTTYITALLFKDAVPELLLEEHATSTVASKDGRFIYLLVQEEKTELPQIWRYDSVTRLQKKIADADSLTTSITLNNNEDTILLSAEKTIIGGISADSGSQLSADDLAVATNLLPEFVFMDNGTNVGMRTKETNTLVTLLPPGTYTTILRNSNIAIMKDGRDRAYLINLTSSSVTQIDIPTALIALNSTNDSLAASDGNEVILYSLQTGEKTLITRQSGSIIALAWHATDNAILLATSSKIFAIEKDKHETRQTTELVSNAIITNMWIDTTGKNITFFGTNNSLEGIWKLPMSQ